MRKSLFDNPSKFRASARDDLDKKKKGKRPRRRRGEGMTRQEAAAYLGVTPNFVSILTGNTARGNRLSKPYTKEKLDAYLESRWQALRRPKPDRISLRDIAIWGGEPSL